MSGAVDIWLERLGCGQYTSVFASRGFWSLQLLSNIEAKVLDDMGVAEKDKTKIMQSLKHGVGDSNGRETAEAGKEPLLNGTSCIHKNPQGTDDAPKTSPVNNNDKEKPLDSSLGQGKENIASPVAEGKENMGDTQRNVCTGKRDQKICDSKDGIKAESIIRLRTCSSDKEEETVENINAYLQELVNGPSDTSLDDTSQSPKKSPTRFTQPNAVSKLNTMPKEDSIIPKDETKADKLQRSSSTSSRDSLENAMSLLMGSPDSSKTSNLTPEVHKPPRKKLKTNDGTAVAPKKRVKKDDSEGVKRKVKKNENKTAKGKPAQAKASQEPPTDKYKGPYVHIDGKPQHPKSVSVINAQVKEVVETKEKAQKKKSSTSQTKVFQSRAGKIGFRSAMAVNYDAHTVDASWVCVFCRLGSHAKGLGDLFGPYFVKKGAASSCNVTVKKEDSSQTSENKEVWFHSQCFIWAPSVYLISSELRGLDDLVNLTEETKCGSCEAFGASLSCVAPSCRSFWHFPCAIESKEIRLDREKLHLHCPKHAALK